MCVVRCMYCVSKGVLKKAFEDQDFIEPKTNFFSMIT